MRGIREYKGKCIYFAYRGLVVIRLSFQRNRGTRERARKTGTKEKRRFLSQKENGGDCPRFISSRRRSPRRQSREGIGREYKISRNSWYISSGKLQMVRDRSCGLTRATSSGGNVTECLVKALGKNEKHSS